jgi:hypothetical protein
LPNATDADPLAGAIIFVPFAIAAAWAVIRKNKDLRLGWPVAESRPTKKNRRATNRALSAAGTSQSGWISGTVVHGQVTR